jgi:hypothetical protein
MGAAGRVVGLRARLDGLAAHGGIGRGVGGEVKVEEQATRPPRHRKGCMDTTRWPRKHHATSRRACRGQCDLKGVLWAVAVNYFFQDKVIFRIL